MDIKILFSDLDGTLVEHAGNITKDTLLNARKLIQNGIELVLVSGRHPDMMKAIHEKIDLNTPIIGCNGGIIKDLASKEILYINELSKDMAKKSIDIAKELDIHCIMYEKDNIFFEKFPPSTYKLPYINSQLPKHLRANYVQISSFYDILEHNYSLLKVLFIFENKMEVYEKGKELLSQIEGVEVFMSANTYLDIMPLGSSKGSAVKKYLELKNIKPENAAAIGDAQNDLDMIKYVGYGVAMGNAMQNLKEAAKVVTSKYPDGFNDTVQIILKK